MAEISDDRQLPGVPTQVSDEARMPLLEHLTELRTRLIRSLLAVLVGFLLAYAFADQLFALLTWPLRSAGHGKGVVSGAGGGEGLFTQLKGGVNEGVFI